MTNAAIFCVLRVMVCAIVLNSRFITSAPTFIVDQSTNSSINETSEIDEDAEYIPSDSFNYLVDYYCSTNQSLADLKLYIPETTVCDERESDLDYWSQMCKCSINSRLECPQCSEAERSIHEPKISHENELPMKYDSSTHHKNVPIHIPSPKLANLIIRRTHSELETHNKPMRHGVPANSTNFIRFG